MAISPISTPNAGAVSTDPTAPPPHDSSLGQQAFLQLLVTQLKNQDPTHPQDNAQMLAQLAQFSTVQGVNNMAASTAQLQGTQLLGKTVTAMQTQGNTQSAVTGQVTGVRYTSTGVSLTVKGATSPITLDQIQSVVN